MGLFSACRALGGLHAAQREFARDKRSPDLTYLFWEATLDCNLACRHCGSWCAPKRSRGEDLPGSEVRRILREISTDFDPRRITIAVTGGEPLVRSDVFEVMAEAHRLGFFWGMVTNATLVTEETLRRMEKAGMGTVSVSVDGDASAHAVLRGSPAAYEKAMRGLGLLLRHGSFLECVQVTSVIGKQNIDLLEGMYDRFADMGVGQWRLLMIDPIGRMRDPANRPLLLDGQDLAHLLDFIAGKRKSGPMAVTFEESGFLGLKYEGQVRGYYFHCPAGIRVGSILHDGAISACPSLERALIEGDARTERFGAVWRGRFRRFRDRESTRRKGPCASCSWWSYCEGGSLHLWDWEGQAPRLCHYRMLKEPARP